MELVPNEAPLEQAATPGAQTSALIPDVSFIVIAYNEEAGIAECVESIQGLAGVGSYEIVVVDDCSSDRTAAIVEELSTKEPAVRLVRHAVNRGRGAARHSGVAAARGTQIAMVDGDIVLPVDWFTRCDAARSAQHVAAVGGVAVPDGDVTFIYNRFALATRPAPPTVSVTGNNGLYGAEVFSQVEMDPTLREGEDVALNRAIEAAGMTAVLIPDLIVEHHETKGFLASSHWLFQSGVGATRQMVRYREVRMPDLALMGQIGTVALGVAFGCVTSLWALAAALPLAFLLVASAAHLHSKFQYRGALVRFALATVANSALLASYFAGRIVGLPVVLVKVGVRPAEAARPRQS